MRPWLLTFAAFITLAPAFRAARMYADTPTATMAGTLLIAPQLWSVLDGPWGTTLTPPENAGHVIIVDLPAVTVGPALSAKDAVWAAWQLTYPGFHRPLKQATPQPARDGWNEVWRYDYATMPAERLVLFAVPRRAAKRWVVTLVETSQMVFERRSAAIELILQSMRAVAPPARRQ